MKNVFDIIKGIITQNYTPTYGEIISENRNEKNMFNNAVRNICSDEEYEEYNNIMIQDRQRLLNENNNTINHNTQRKINNTSVSISGIGEVNQVC